MCGFIVYQDINRQSKLPVEKCSKYLEKIKRRGPDNSTCDVHESCGLVVGHVRLSIIDLAERANQPFYFSDRWALVYNGEIYNHLEIKNDLEAKGYKFNTESDTEVLSLGLIEYGDQIFELLDGMYSAVAIDLSNGDVVYARDPFGIKPLYFYEDSQIRIWCSSSAELIDSGLIDKGLDSNSIKLYQIFGFIPEPFTMWSNVRSVKPGHVFSVRNKQKFERVLNTNLKALYENADLFSRDVRSDRFRHDLVMKALSASCKAQTIADVEVTLLLSGGMDSAVIGTSLVDHPTINTLTILPSELKDTSWDEETSAVQTAQRLNIKHHKISIDLNETSLHLKKWLEVLSEPTIDGLNLYIACQQARNRGAKVVLCGMGADELFGGYKFYNHASLVFWLSNVIGEKNVRALIKIFFRGPKRKIANWPLSLNCLVSVYLAFRSLGDVFIGGPTAPEDVMALAKIKDRLLQELPKVKKMSTQQRIRFLDTVFYLRSQLLKSSDEASMANSVELRVPYLSTKLYWEICRSRNNMPKSKKNVFKKLLTDAKLEHLLVSSKTGFAIPTIRQEKADYVTGIYSLKADILSKIRSKR